MLPIQTNQQGLARKETNSWQCKHCHANFQFSNAIDFARHLEEAHSIKEGGSYICRYGNNDVCSSLPLEGVSDQDYKDHVMKKHVNVSSSTDLIGKSIGTVDYTMSSSSSSGFRNIPSNLRTTIGLNASNTTYVEADASWTVYDSTQNLAAVLNDPRLTKRESDFFTKTWGETFTENAPILPPPHLPTISSLLFKNYLKKTSKRTKQLKTLASNSQQKAGISSSDGSNRTLASLLEKNRSSLEVVPKVFLTTPFELENSDTFNQVLPWSQISSDSNAASKSSVKLLQEKLSHYLDVVEVQIARQISLKSEAFFQAMTSHDALMDQLTKNIQAVRNLRKQIHCIDDVLVKNALRCLRLKQSRNNCHFIYNKLKLMSTVHQTQPTVQLLLATSEFAGALDLIATTKDIAEQELVGIHCFRHLNSQLAEIEIVIDKMMQADFVRHISTQLNRPLPSKSDSLDGYQTEEEETRISEEERLISIVFGMLRLNKFEFVDVFQEEAKTAVKAIVKQTEIEAICKSDHGDVKGDDVSLTNQISKLEFSLWLELLNKVFSNLLLLLKRIHALQVVMLDIVEVAAGTPLSAVEEFLKEDLVEVEPSDASKGAEAELATSASIISLSEHLRLSKSLNDAMASIRDQANERCVKILSQRTSGSSNRDANELEKMRAADFVELAHCIEMFIKQTSEFSGKPSTQLKLALQSMSTKFTLRFHKEKINKLSNILNSEQWVKADVPAKIQELVSQFFEISSLENADLNQSAAEFKTSSIGTTENYLTAGKQKYAVVGTVLLLLSIISEYCECSRDVPIVGIDMSRNLVELLKFYNSRTCQLILGAGALQLVGLKTITTKHLALASRSLQLMVHFIPIIKTQFEILINDKEKPVTKHFDQVLRDYNNHINEISNKFVGIMDDKLESLLSKWEVRAPVPSPAFRSISKHLSKLHEAVADLLPESQLREIFRRIHLSFKEKLKTHLVRLKVNSDGGPQHGLVTQELTFYTENLKLLNIFPESSNLLEDLFFTNPNNSNNNNLR